MLYVLPVLPTLVLQAREVIQLAFFMITNLPTGTRKSSVKWWLMQLLP